MQPIDQALLQYQAQTATPPSSAPKDRLREVSEEFEAIFLKQMLDSMRNTIQREENGLTQLGTGGEFFEDMLYDEYSKVMAKTGGIGIADMIYDQLSSRASLEERS
jgi:flagellar protein FlgJ